MEYGIQFGRNCMYFQQRESRVKGWTQRIFHESLTSEEMGRASQENEKQVPITGSDGNRDTKTGYLYRPLPQQGLKDVSIVNPRY